MANTPVIGIIGIGAMGMAMAKNLQRRGFNVAVRDVRDEAAAQARELGLLVCATPAAVAAAAGLIAIVVVNAQQIDEVLFGAGGIAAAAAAGKTLMICSTIAPADTIRFAAALAPLGIELIDAPISGGPGRAEVGAMSMMLAGADSLIARWEPVLAALAEKRFYISETVGDGAKAKLVNNLMAGINLAAGAEALSLGIKIGLDPHTLFDMICVSSGASWMFQDRMGRALQDDFAPRAAVPILTKDMTLATELAAASDHPAPLGLAALARYRQTLDEGWGALDDAAVIKPYLKTR